MDSCFDLTLIEIVVLSLTMKKETIIKIICFLAIVAALLACLSINSRHRQERKSEFEIERKMTLEVEGNMRRDVEQLKERVRKLEEKR